LNFDLEEIELLRSNQKASAQKAQFVVAIREARICLRTASTSISKKGPSNARFPTDPDAWKNGVNGRDVI